MSQETNILVTEFSTFASAWEAATETKSRFDYYQGMEQKIKYIKQADRWFVDMDTNILYYSHKTKDGVRIVKEADPISSLTNYDFQYVQIMVSSNPELNPSNTGKLRFTGQYVTRENAIKLTKEAEVFAFNK